MKFEFNGGTILCGPKVDPVLRALPFISWDGRVKQYRLPAYRYSDLVEASGGKERSQIRLLPRHKRVGTWRMPELRPYQELALSSWKSHSGRGIIVLPTGSGKTRTAIAGMAQLQKPTLCLVPTRALIHQWQNEISQYYFGPIGILGDQSHQIEAVTIATFESAYRHMGRIGNQFELLLVDEVHHFGGTMRDEALEMSVAPRRLGLTATLPSNPEKRNRLEELVGKVVYQLNVADLKGTFLAPFDIYTLYLDLTAIERKAYETHMGQFRNFFGEFRKSCPEASWKDFVRTASCSDSGRHAIASWREARKLIAYTQAKQNALTSMLKRFNHRKVLVFTADTDTAYQISRKHLIMPITSEIGRKERTFVLNKFREGELRALVSCRVLNEGLDVPEADTAIVVGGNHGQLEHIQRIGRVLRPREGKRAEVFELISDNTVEIRQSKKRQPDYDSGIAHSV